MPNSALTIMTPFASRKKWVPEFYIKTITALDLCLSEGQHPSFVFVNNSGNPSYLDPICDAVNKIYPESTIHCIIDDEVFDNPNSVEKTTKMYNLWWKMKDYVDGDYVLSLEDDVVPTPDAITKMKEFLNSDSNIAFVSAAVRRRGGGWMNHAIINGVMKHWIQDDPFEVHLSHMSCVLFRGDVFQKLSLKKASNYVWEHTIMNDIKAMGMKAWCLGYQCVAKHYASPERFW